MARQLRYSAPDAGRAAGPKAGASMVGCAKLGIVPFLFE